MSDPFIGEIKIVGFNYPMKGWALCNGQILPINQNAALFSLLGTMYGGNGTTTFALPNLQGRAPVHAGNEVQLGQAGGEENHVLSSGEMAAHSHAAFGTTSGPAAGNPAGSLWATLTAAQNPYGQAPNAQMAAAAIHPVGTNQPHANLQPHLVLNFVIALQGIFPSRS
jgi:microcystin-dependent protein